MRRGLNPYGRSHYSELMRLIKRFLFLWNLLLNTSTSSCLIKAKVELRERHSIKVFVLLGILLVALYHGNIRAHISWIACQIHLVVQITMDA